jgi:hypothetical protein
MNSAWEPSVDQANIGVTVHDGIATLMGHFETYAEKLAAEMLHGGSTASRRWPRNSRYVYLSA